MSDKANKIGQHLPAIIGNSKRALLLISIITGILIIDIQFVSISYGTNLEIPINFQLSLFTLLSIVGSVICIVLIIIVKKYDETTRISRPQLFRVSFLSTTIVQISIILMLFLVILEMLIFHEYFVGLLLSMIYSSHFISVALLVILALTFIHWFKFTRSVSIITYAIVFIVIITVLLLTIPLLTEQYLNQPQWIYPRSYSTLVDILAGPSRSIAFLYGLQDYVLPIMIISSWILTASLLRTYRSKIGQMRFWLLISIPLLYQLFTYVVKNTDFVTDPNLIQIIYSSEFQLLIGISYQISGLIFAIAFLTIARKTQRKVMKNYLIISAIGIAALFSSMQPGIPFYTSYPPFGLVAILFLGLSTYMLLIGILGYAAYVSADSELRREVVKGIETDSHLFMMGRAEMQRAIESRVRIAYDKINLAEEMRARIDTDEDIKVMIGEVLDELHPRSDGTNKE
jgi:hypothetical protein